MVKQFPYMGVIKLLSGMATHTTTDKRTNVYHHSFCYTHTFHHVFCLYGQAIPLHGCN